MTTRVSYQLDSQNKFRCFSIKNHANYAESGRDIVCAAISAITNGTINFLFAYYSNACQIICQPTKITIYPNTDNLDCQLCLRLMLYQLKNVANHYPRYLKIREEKTLTEENLG